MNWSNSNKDCAFQSNRNSGFQMNVNGFRISVQFGPGNYVADGDIRYRTEQDAPMTFNHWGTDTAEVLIWDRNNMPIDWENGDDRRDEVVGWVKSDTVGRLIGCLASCPPDFDPTQALNQIVSDIRL